MSKPYLEVTYRGGKPFAAYLYLSPPTDKPAARSERRGSLVVDFSRDGKPLGIEFTDVGLVELAAVNQVLAESQTQQLGADDLIPLLAA